MTRSQESSPPTLIERQKDLDQLVALCTSEGQFAFDTEFVMEDRYESEVCLIQIATREGVALIDPFLKLDLSGFWALVADEKIEKIVHAGQEDLAISVQYNHRPPRRIFDTQIAAGFTGLDYPLSLQRLVQTLNHVRLHKTKTLTDWRKRPLTAEQIHYAAEDVGHLLAVHRKLGDRLTELDRMSWAREELAHFEDLTLYRRAEADRLMRIKGAGSLRGQEVVVLQALYHYRDEFAQRVNRPARVVLKDHLMVEMARQKMTKFSDIRDLRGVNLSDREVHHVCKVVKDALAVPAAEWPEAKPYDAEAPWEATVQALATAVIRGYCLEHDLAYSLVATQKMIRDLIRFRTGSASMKAVDVELLSGWRGETVGALLDDLFTGRRTVRVKSGSNGEVLHIRVE